jgi:hypothetical protein
VVWRCYDRVGDEGTRAWLWNGALTDITDPIDAVMSHEYSLHAGGIA